MEGRVDKFVKDATFKPLVKFLRMGHKLDACSGDGDPRQWFG